MKIAPRRAIAIAVVAAFLVGPVDAAVQTPATQGSPGTGFRSRDAYFTDGAPFDDETIDELLATLDELLARPATLADFERLGRNYLWNFVNRLTMGRLMPEQTARILSYLDDLATARPEHAVLLARYDYTVRNLLIGSAAQNIVGRDLDGVEFELADYRGKIVVLVFTGHWCAPCRREYPYQRLLLELMADEPVVLLGVSSDASVEIAKASKQSERLDYRMWWDGYGGRPTSGPIAQHWSVTGWPTVYVIDEEGFIRYRDPMQEKLIEVVKILLAELEMKQRRGDSQ